MDPNETLRQLQALTETYMTEFLGVALNTVMCDAQAIVEHQPLRAAAVKELRNKYSFLSLAVAAAFIDYATLQKLIRTAE